MRIFLSSQQALRRHAVPSYGFWELYFKNGLTEAGHSWVEAPGVDWAQGLTHMTSDARQAWLEDTWGRTLDWLQAEHARQPIDLFLSYLFPNQVEPSVVSAIRDLGIPCVNFFCDNVREFTRVPASYRPFDLHWVPEAEARALYVQAGLPFVYAPMPVWVPEIYRRLPERENGQVVFIGSTDALREDLLSEAAELGLAFEAYGPGWAPGEGTVKGPAPQTWPKRLANQFAFFRQHGFRGFAMRETYRRRKPRPRAWLDRHGHPPLETDAYFIQSRESQVLLGINRYPSFRHSFQRPHVYSRLRDLEAPMLGACYLTEWAPGLDDLYDLGREIETYRDAAELVEKAAQLGRDPARRHELRRCGQRRVLAHHTIGRSLDLIRDRLGLAGG